MPRRTLRLAPPLLLALAAVVVGVGLAACQDYNFSPVRYCLIQPGTERVTLSDISTADILFVVDDSGSMGGEQVKLGESFDAFVKSLKTSNEGRVASQLEPIDFHIAVTTTSVFLNAQTTASCSTTCGGTAGQQVCCKSDTGLPLQAPRGCATAAQCTAGNQCLTTCRGRAGELTCCLGANASPELAPVACTDLGAACGLLQDRYAVPRSVRACQVTADCAAGPNPAPTGYSCRTDCRDLGSVSACCADAAPHDSWLDPACTIGVGAEGALYPRGDFVRPPVTAPATPNPRVLHFDKSLFCARTADGKACACNHTVDPVACDPPVRNDAAIDTLIAQFKQNVAVGTCGSGQEQGLEAARRAIQKAVALNALTARPAEPRPDLQPDIQPGEWLHAKSKLVVVFVGDEDDCSSPESPTRGVIFNTSGNDACEADGSLPADQQRRTKLQEYADFLTSLGRPVAGAFIVSATSETCVDRECVAGLCCDTVCTGNVNVCSTDMCGGQGAGYRFVSLEEILRQQKGADTVLGSVCNPGTLAKPGFSSILERVAEVVKQPAALHLPTQPAAAKLTLLRIAGTDGKTRKTCRGPALLGQTVAEAELAGLDWWFTGGDDTDRTPTGPSKFIYINRQTHNCEANPGETYSADYLGLVPASGCLSSADCQAAIGGVVEDWTCDRSQGGALGTCLCGSYPNP